MLEQTVSTAQDEPLCLVFHVNMFGSGIGSLKVVEEVGGGQNIVGDGEAAFLTSGSLAQSSSNHQSR